MSIPPTSADHVHDVAGVGFGPSNLALAIAIHEHNAAAPDGLDAVFFERQAAFGWHRGMLIDGATMQVSFLKDLVTLRNPGSAFSFLHYLRERGRLVDFINHKTLFPSREEFHDYLEWAAGRFAGQVAYGAEVVSVSAVRRAGAIEAIDVVVRQGGRTAELVTHRTRNLVIAAGLEPVLPDGVVPGERIWHTSELLHRLPALTRPRRLLVVGAGQSAAETVEYLHRTYPSAEICAVFTKYGYTPADDSSFANRIFDPAAVDDFYAAPDDVKRMLMDYHGSTNYSVVDMELIDELYRRLYQEKVSGQRRLRIMNVSRITGLAPHDGGVRATVRFLPTGEQTTLDADAVVYATGYRMADPRALLGEVGQYCLQRADGSVQVERDYRIATTDDVRCGLYLQGATEHTHGLTSSLLSNTAVRAGEIVTAIATRRPVYAAAVTDDGGRLVG
jgi:L-ornithine N5-monooxygenase